MKTTKEMIEVMQAYEDEKNIECARIGDWEWETDFKPIWNWDEYVYRIKKEPTYRPYESVNEMLDDFCERCREHGMTVSRSSMGEPFIWLLSKDRKAIKLVTGFTEMNNLKVYLNGSPTTFKYIFDEYTYKDGSPCGKKVEE